jgi:23S rRNA pseudouridine2605 synthase
MVKQKINRPGSSDDGRHKGPRGVKKAAKQADSKTKPLAEDAGDDFDPDFESAASEPAAPELVRLNKFLADHGVASRRKCDELIEAGKVTVDGEPVNELGMKIDPQEQVVEIEGFILKPRDSRKRYYVLNKPSGVVCTNEQRETRPRAVDLITDPYKGRIYTVGRLDEESKGLIILTNDGEFANRIMHPRYGIQKTYMVRVAGKIDDDTVTQIREGVHLSEGRTSGARILIDRRTVEYSQLTLTISEGMNREIRRVFARFGYKVTELRRVRIGPLTDRGLKPGRWRELLSSEVSALIAGETQEAERPRLPRGALPKRFPKKRGYARDIVRGGKVRPGVRRTLESATPAGASTGRGPNRNAIGKPASRGARSFGAKTSGPRAAGARFGGKSGGKSGGPKRNESGPGRRGSQRGERR